MAKMTIVFRDDERAALRTLAAREERYPRDLAVLIIRRELERAGLLPADATKTQAQADGVTHVSA